MLPKGKQLHRMIHAIGKKYKKLRNKINSNIKTSKASYYSNAFIQSRIILDLNELTSRRVNNIFNNWAQTC